MPFVLLCFLCTGLRGLSHFRDRQTESIPARFLSLELLSSRAREFVKLRFTASLVHVPTRRDPTFLLDAIERGIQRSLLHMQHFVGELPNALNNSIPVQLSERERLEYEHIERPL